MGKVSVLLVVLSIAVSKLDAQYYINSVLLAPRLDYASYKYNCFESVDTYYYRSYASLNAVIFSTVAVYENQNLLLSACFNFTMSRLNKTASKNLKSTCDTLNATFKNARPTAEKTLMTYHKELLGSSPELMETAQELYSSIKDSLNNMVPFYAAKPNCVGVLLRNFTDVYKLVSNDISTIYQRMQFNISKVFSNTSTAARSTSYTLATFRHNLINCNNSKTDPSECVIKLVTNVWFGFCLQYDRKKYIHRSQTLENVEKIVTALIRF